MQASCKHHSVSSHQCISMYKYVYLSSHENAYTYRDRHQGLIYMHVSILTKIPIKRQKETCPGYQSWQWYICWNQYTCLYRGGNDTFNFLNDNWYLNIRTPSLCVSLLLYYFMFVSIFTFYVILYSYLFSSLNLSAATATEIYGPLLVMTLSAIHVPGRRLPMPKVALIANFIGPHGAHLGPTGPRCAPCGHH